MRSGVYRLRQFVRGFTAQVSAKDGEVLDQILTPMQRHLFGRMPVDAQRHSLNVLSTLHNAGHTDDDLAVAALLHDVGKVAAMDVGAYLGIWMRGPMVILETVAPHLLPRLASPQPSPSWRYAIHVQNAHPQIGAVWAQEAGCNALTCWLIAHHQDKDLDALDPSRRDLLQTLQWADNRN